MRIWVALLLFAQISPAATEFFSWHTFDTVLVQKGRFELTAHQRTRTRHELQYLDQVRGGPVARWTASRRLVVIAGYYYQPQQIRQDVWKQGSRFFGGLERPLYVRPNNVVAGRFVVERHINTGRPAFTRYRTSLRWTTGRGRVRPFLQNELLAVWPGFHSTRNSGGLQMRLGEGVSLDVSYLYDTRRTFWGGDRQAIVTSLKWVPAWRKH